MEIRLFHLPTATFMPLGYSWKTLQDARLKMNGLVPLKTRFGVTWFDKTIDMADVSNLTRAEFILVKVNSSGKRVSEHSLEAKRVRSHPSPIRNTGV